MRSPLRTRLIASLLALAGGSVALPVVHADVVGHWSFDEYGGESNTKFVETTGARNGDGLKLDASIDTKGMVTLVAGADIPFGKAAKFEGKKGSFLNLPYTGGLYKNSFTIAVWVNADTAQKYSVLSDWISPNYSFYFGLEPAGNGVKPSVTLRNNVITTAKNKKTKGNFTSVINNYQPNAIMPLHSWHHVAWVWDRQDDSHGTMTIYVDGKSVGSQAQQHAPLDLQNNVRGLKIGLKQDTDSAFDGALDEMWIFSQALTADQVANLKNSNSLDGSAAIASAATGTATPTATSQPATSAIAAASATSSTEPAKVAAAETSAEPSKPTEVAVAPKPEPSTSVEPSTRPATAIASAPTATPPASPSSVTTGVNPLAGASHVSAPAASTPPTLTASNDDAVDENGDTRTTAQVPLFTTGSHKFTPLRSLGIVLSAASTIGLSCFLIWAIREKFRMRSQLPV